jgi:hypothetical protein
VPAGLAVGAGEYEHCPAGATVQAEVGEADLLDGGRTSCAGAQHQPHEQDDPEQGDDHQRTVHGQAG